MRRLHPAGPGPGDEEDPGRPDAPAAGPDPRDGVARMYESAIRAIDTKAQIFLALLTITVSPIFARLSAFEASLYTRAGTAAVFLGCCAMFVLCLIPRGDRGGMLFNPARSAEEVRAHVARPDFAPDLSATIGVLHRIYAAKTRRLRIGVALLALYLAIIGATFVAP